MLSHHIYPIYVSNFDVTIYGINVFSYIASDSNRALMLFATGKPLGENGLDWLKIHLVNLHGEKKK